MPGSHLPVLPHPGADEPLGDWVVRLAAHNRMSPHQVMEHPMDATMLRRLDRFAYPDELDRLHDLSGLPAEQLRSMTLAGRFPGTTLDSEWVSTRDARRAGDTACTHCGMEGGLTALLRLMPLCGRCGHLLDDGTGYTEPDIDPHLTQIQRLVTGHAQVAHTYAELRNRVDRMRYALRHNWPIPPAHEPPGRLAHALRLLADDPTSSSPTVTAVLLARVFDPAIENNAELLIRHDTGWCPTTEVICSAPLGDVTAEITRLRATIGACEVEVRHVPLAITLGAPTPLVRPSCRARRETWAATVRDHVAAVTGTRSTLHRAMLCSPTRWPDDDPWTIRLLTDTITALHRDGLLDRERALETFRHHASVPTRVLRRLPPAARESANASGVAAAWVELTMTGAGRLLARSLHRAGTLIPHFHDALTAEGRLVLTEYGHQELCAWPDAATSVAAPANSGRQPSARQDRRVG